uniref:Uncharacterized protein n=1 Tax=Glossina austeni TaxID=7395 RepID=A0A1A9VSE5_GLOAU
MSNKYHSEVEVIQVTTKHYIIQLIEIWSTMFDDESCKENLKKLLKPTSDFYRDLLEQSVTKRSCIEKEIKELKKEAEDIKRFKRLPITSVTLKLSNDVERKIHLK